MRTSSSPRVWGAFDAVFRRYRDLHLERVLMGGLPDPAPAGPLLLVANHTSWWDGFLLREVQRRLRPHGRPYTVMLDRELGRRPLLRLLGGVGITPGDTAGLRRAVATLVEARRSHAEDFVLFFFPQGRIWPSHRRPLGFEPGIERLAEVLAPATILPVGIHLEPLNAAAPTACLLAGEPIPVGGRRVGLREIEGSVWLQVDRLHRLTAQYGEDLPRVWDDAARVITSALPVQEVRP